jgi:hypothetical protein
VRNVREAESLIPDHEVAAGKAGKDDDGTTEEQEGDRSDASGEGHSDIDDGTKT